MGAVGRDGRIDDDNGAAMWGIVIGLGIAMALQPLPVLAVVLLLSVENGIRKAWAFVLGEFTVMLAIGVATVGLHLGTSPAQASRPASFVTLVLGIAIFGTGAWWGLRVRRGSEASVPGWMAKLDHMQPWPAFVLGLFLPTYMLALAVGAHIVGTDPTTAAAVAGILTFLLIGMSTAYVPVLLAQFAPDASAPARSRLRAWLEVSWPVVVAALLLGVGAFLIGKAVVALV